MTAADNNVRPPFDKELIMIADYIANHSIKSELAYSTARYCLMDALNCGILALKYPKCTKLLGPIVPNTVVPNGVRVPGTRYEFMMLDEIQSGMGRTGKWFYHQVTNIKPDVMTVAKALGNGVPIGACLVRDKACNLFGPGKHGCTFGGNPFVCAVGSSVIDVMEKENLVQHAEKIGHYLLAQLKEKLNKYKNIVDIRGKGLMIGIELDKPCMELVKIGLKHQLLFNVTFNKVIRLLPPLIITEKEADEIVNKLDKVMQEYIRAPS